MPNNFRHIGLIQLILPNAKIIDARRHPLACCFSGFKQLFSSGQEFTYGLTNIGRYYRDYIELMAHWDNVLPGRVLRVHHSQWFSPEDSKNACLSIAAWTSSRPVCSFSKASGAFAHRALNKFGNPSLLAV